MPLFKLRAVVAVAALMMGCQLAVDFPSREGSDGSGAVPPDAGAGADAAFDAALSRDAAAAREAGDEPQRDSASSDAATSPSDAASGRDDGAAEASPCDLATHAGCATDELCCAAGAAAARCVKTSSTACSACGTGCSDPRAPHCAGRACGCLPGSNASCQAGELCLGAAADARCAQCTRDADCASVEGKKQCVAERCVECDRGALADVSDDEGCALPASPVCDTMNRCVACRRDPNDCPAGSYCNGALGCQRCDTSAAPGSNGCPTSTPVCRMDSSGQAACSGCRINQDCGAGRYCDSVSGVCTDACDPGGPLGDNGCSGALPYCRASGASFACGPCTASDCSGAAPHCSLIGSTQGKCVGCRNTADCAGNLAQPTCDASSGMCRATQMTDCVAPTPVLVQGACVECGSDAHCAAAAGRPYCDAATKRCVACTGQPALWCSQRSPTTPYCEPSNGQCVACRLSTDCSARLNPSRTPICSNGACVACNAPNLPTTQRGCTDDLGGPTCIVAGPEAGRCAAPAP